MSMLNQPKGAQQFYMTSTGMPIHPTRTGQIQELIKEQESFRKTTQELVKATESLKEEVALFRRDFQESRKDPLVKISKAIWRFLAQRYQRLVVFKNELMEQDKFRSLLAIFIGCAYGYLVGRLHLYILQNRCY